VIMPVPGDSSRATTRFAVAALRVSQFVWYAVLIGVTVFCLTLLAIRFIVFPRVDDYRDRVAAALTRQLGEPVEIDRLATGWDGWNPKLVVHGFRVKSSTGAATDPALLDLPEVSLIVAWTSLPALDLRLKELGIEGPRLAVRRDKSGDVRIGGIAVDFEK